ncbi:unnamed protein product [Protopolystoma xenopodis]|uniref:Uncharacterized protein n=1 Tax=Protopolystoma xenopodis TaxID=117903 RepID=A0A3S5BMN2_9PLAT|nr:unnamed protein product [Protopolystoma xenopodis]
MEISIPKLVIKVKFTAPSEKQDGVAAETLDVDAIAMVGTLEELLLEDANATEALFVYTRCFVG